jgi:hypothetical protein
MYPSPKWLRAVAAALFFSSCQSGFGAAFLGISPPARSAARPFIETALSAPVQCVRLPIQAFRRGKGSVPYKSKFVVQHEFSLWKKLAESEHPVLQQLVRDQDYLATLFPRLAAKTNIPAPEILLHAWEEAAHRIILRFADQLELHGFHDKKERNLLKMRANTLSALINVFYLMTADDSSQLISMNYLQSLGYAVLSFRVLMHSVLDGQPLVMDIRFKEHENGARVEINVGKEKKVADGLFWIGHVRLGFDRNDLLHLDMRSVKRGQAAAFTSPWFHGWPLDSAWMTAGHIPKQAFAKFVDAWMSRMREIEFLSRRRFFRSMAA